MANDDDDDKLGPLPPVSTITRPPERRYRVLTRTSGQFGRDRFRRAKKQVELVEALRHVIEHHGITEELRQRSVCLYWREIVGDSVAAKTYPTSFCDGVFSVAVTSASWSNELRLRKDQLVSRINAWVLINKAWLGADPIAKDLRFDLGMRERNPLVALADARRLRRYHRVRIAERTELDPPSGTNEEREAILAEVAAISDRDLRDIVERVRLKWFV